MATKIVRITRHEAETSQTAVLKQFFGQDMEVIVVNETMPMESKAFVARFDEVTMGADVVEGVLPPNLLEAALKFSAFAKRGGQILRATMNRVARIVDGSPALNDKGEQIYDFVFDHYEVVEKVEVVTHILGEQPKASEVSVTREEAIQMWLELHHAWMEWANFGGWPSDAQKSFAGGLQIKLGIAPNQERDSSYRWDYRDYVK